jgi:hypothetical protein
LKNPDDEEYLTQDSYEEETGDSEDHDSNDTDYWQERDNSEGRE